MTREEQIAIASCAYGSRGSSIDFTVGAKWADSHPKSPWISVKADLPCNHEELISPDDKRDTLYVVAVIRGHIIFSRMRKLEGKWFWENDEPTHWFPIPKSPK